MTLISTPGIFSAQNKHPQGPCNPFQTRTAARVATGQPITVSQYANTAFPIRLLPTYPNTLAKCPLSRSYRTRSVRSPRHDPPCSAVLSPLLPDLLASGREKGASAHCTRPGQQVLSHTLSPRLIILLVLCKTATWMENRDLGLKPLAPQPTPSLHSLACREKA